MLVAPPGAGKTTRVPLVLAGEEWAQSKRRILVLEPRRLAARAAAERMAKTLGERVGETVGLRVRFGSKLSRKTRIEILTEGVFTRLILDDPMLEGVAAILFDEFHERSLDADLGLGFGARRAAGLARGFTASGDVGDHRRRPRGKPSRRRARDRRRGPRLPGRDPLSRPRRAADRAANRRRHCARDARRYRLAARISARRRRNPPHPGAARRPFRSLGRCRRALWRARGRRAGPRHRAGRSRPAQDRAGHLDRRDLDHHRGRAHRDRTPGLPACRATSPMSG